MVSPTGHLAVQSSWPSGLKFRQKRLCTINSESTFRRRHHSMPSQTQLPLGHQNENEPPNLLPQQGEVLDYGVIFSPAQADRYLHALLSEIPWKSDQVVIFGKTITTARQVAWYGDRNYNYTYSGRTRSALVWTPELAAIKKVVEQHAGASYNSCLLNLYADGSQGMGWHQDNEKELGPNPHIASVSLGAERRFDLRHKESREKVSVALSHGSLIVMKGSTQHYWQHQIAKTTKVTEPRVNLTFRTILP